MIKKEIAGHWFQWDNDKAEINKRKHGIRFETAARVFADENRKKRRDDIHSTNEEERWQTIGQVNGILFVVYTERSDSTRIIMARKASPKERRAYYDSEEIY